MYFLRLLPLLLIIYQTDSRPPSSRHTEHQRPGPGLDIKAQNLINSPNPSSWDWFDLPDHDLGADTLANDHYNTFHQMRDQVHFYAPALHVGKIYRGHFQNPQYVQPRHRAMGWDSDFNHGDKDAFRNVPNFPKPQCEEVVQSSGGFDCRCGVPRRKERDPHAAALGTIATDGTGAAMPAMEAVVGGVATERHEYPWQVGLYLRNFKDRIFCGGSILSSMTILTAAHCTFKFTEQEKQNLRVMISQTRGLVSNLDQHINVCRVDQHSNYDSVTQDNDFAILTLCTAIKFNPSAQPICLPSLPGNEYEGVQATLSGWGDTDADENNLVLAEELMEANVTTIPNSVCIGFYVPGASRPNTPNNVVTENNICAMMEGKDACEADSGGPLVVQEPCGHFAQVGVVSWGEGCANPLFPGVYSRVTQRLDWIESRVQGKTCPPPSLLSVN